MSGDGGREDRVLAGVLAALALAVLALAARLPGATAADPVGPRGFPGLLALVLLACGVALGLRPGASDPERDAPGAFAATAALLGVALTTAYLAALEPAGFLLATPPYVAALLLARGGIPLRALILTALALPLGLYVLFRVAMRVALPPGPLEPLLRAI